MKTYYSSGKLLLTGEYAVLDGALCLALPTVFGQQLKITHITDPIIQWTSRDHDHTVWFQETISLDNLHDISERAISGMTTSEILLQVLGLARQLNPEFLSENSGFEVITQLEFPRKWGLGTSSTLITNIAQWADVDPYVLLEKTFGGSGYDIACAQSKSPLLYQLHEYRPRVVPIDFKPPFSSSLFFVYLNRKQDSREAIRNYRNQDGNPKDLVAQITALTKAIVACNQLEKFESLLRQHESLIADALELPTVKESLFPDYPRMVKSLGAWGGDFVLAVGGDKERDYFRKKGYKTIIPYTEMIA
ncbi:MAG: GHMP kinase [Flavobacteriaceae bacterium]|nr:GHMP kinase [Flavobacteriaceae bacterium]